MLLVQEYLKTHSLADLERDHGVKNRIHEGKFSLNYDQLESKESDKLACQCRGLILARLQNGDAKPLDENMVVGNTIVLCRPFDRFFNHGQAGAADINFEADGVKFYEKLDGTCCLLYWDMFKCEWYIATRSVPEADLPIDNILDYTFRTLFEKALKDCTGYSSFKEWTRFANLSVTRTYIFELCTPVNRIVVDYKDYTINLIGVRNNLTGNEYSIEHKEFKNLNVPVCRTYDLKNLTDLIDFVSNCNPLEQEGIVACDDNFNRVKVKNPSYLALNRVRDAVAKSPRALLELCLQERLDDAMPLIPDYLKDKALETQEGLRRLLKASDGLYGTLLEEARENVTNDTEGELRKQLALAVQRNKAWMPYVMSRFTGKVKTCREFIDNQKNPDSGEYPKSLLDNLLRQI